MRNFGSVDSLFPFGLGSLQGFLKSNSRLEVLLIRLDCRVRRRKLLFGLLAQLDLLIVLTT
jgi:hypothetical protein